MGGRYQSTAVRGASAAEVRRVVESWLERRGFRLVEAPLVPCHDDVDRGLYLFSRDGWTVLVYSRSDEEQRLARELMNLERPLLHVWLFGSDVWGYALLDEGRTIAEFDSNPEYIPGHPGEPFLDPPQVGDIRSGSPEELSRRLHLPGLDGPVAALQRKRAVFMDGVVEKFCTTLGIAPAAAHFDYLEQGYARGLEGWHVESLRYTKEDEAAGEGIDLHSEAAWSQPEDGSRQEPVPGAIPPPMHPMFPVVALMRTLMLPLILVARAVGWLMSLAPRSRALEPSFTARLPGHPPPFRVEGRHVLHPLHGCRVLLPPGAEALPHRAGPWVVFAVQLRGVEVVCTPHRLAELRALGGATKPLEDERYFAGALKARRRLFEIKRPAGTLQHEIHVVQTPRALYQWRVNLGPRTPALSPEARADLRALVASFELIAAER